MSFVSTSRSGSSNAFHTEIGWQEREAKKEKGPLLGVFHYFDFLD